MNNANFAAKELEARVVSLPEGKDLESYICSSSFRPVALVVAKEFKPALDNKASNETLADALRAHKPMWARRAGDELRASPPKAKELPDAFARIRKALIEHEAGDGAAANS